MNRKSGISLIVLVITIIIIIILAGSIILSLVNNNPISQASKAIFLSDVRNFQAELALYETQQFVDRLGAYDIVLLQADDTSVTYGENVDTSITMNNIIESLGKAKKYAGEFEVIEGKLVYKGSDENRQDWVTEIGMEVIITGEPTVTVFPPTETVVQPGTDITYTVRFSSNAALSSIDLTDKVSVIDDSGTAIANQPVIIIGTVSGLDTDSTREVDLTIKTDNLLSGVYRIRIQSGVVLDANDATNTQDTISPIAFDIVDNQPPENPVMSANITAWTNTDVLVTITYSEDSVIKEYSLDGSTWNAYTSPVVVTTNNTTVYARGKDSVGNESGVATLTVANIDKTSPTITASSLGSTSSSITIGAVANDGTGSGINLTSYQYSIDNGLTWTPVTNLISYTFTSLSSGTYQCKSKVVDIAGNTGISSAVGISTQGLGTVTIVANPTLWTNGNVTVTISYPLEVVTKQYSLDGTTWSTYTVPVTVTTNNTTVYARGYDIGNNQTTQVTYTVSNIDKVEPTVTYGTNGGTGATSVSTTVTVNDLGGSNVNTATLQYVWDTQNTVTPVSGWAIFTNGSVQTKTGEGIYYLWIKGSDNAGNSVVSKTNAFTIGDVETIVSTVQTVNKTFSGATTGYSYNNPVIPAGFVAVNTTEASWNSLSTNWGKGLVIQDASGNQFVWVPVDGVDVPYAKWTTTGVAYNDPNITDASLPAGFLASNITTTYKGFYIARYESRFDYNGGNIRAASKKSLNITYDDWSTTRNSSFNGYLWNYINSADAKLYAENMATKYGYDTTKVGTNLVTGAQWDTTLKWIQWSGKSPTDSRSWGNYSNSTSPANVSGYGNMQISGYSNSWRVKNIYDLAGNLMEFTNELYSSWNIHRGGGHSYSGSTDPAAVRGYANAVATSYVFDSITFRIALFVR